MLAKIEIGLERVEEANALERRARRGVLPGPREDGPAPRAGRESPPFRFP